jgi:DNA modification methylase
VLDARQGYWQRRKAAWIGLGIQSELGRGESAGTRARADEPTYRQIKNRVSPGGSPRPAATLKDGHTVRGNGKAAAIVGNSGGPGELGHSYHNADKYNDRFDERTRRALGVYAVIGQAAVPLDRESGVTGTSIFDPVLAELIYRWFMPQGGHVLDPFAGGSVRGVVASMLGKKYTGVDLSAAQIEANRKQAEELTPDNQPTWIVGDSKNITTLAPGEYDLVFSCPPYADLEIYSDDPNDLSTMSYPDFKTAYHEIIYKSVAMLKDNRFACFVVGDVRNERGFYRNFPAHTIDAFQDAGMTLYNEAILVTAVGSLPIRVGRQFDSGRKLGKTHQNVLIFYKGNPKAIRDFGAVEFGELEGADEVAE